MGCPPAPVYKGARGEADRPSMGAPGGGVLLLVGVGLPFPTPTRRRKGRRRGRRKEREEKEERGQPPSPIRFGLGGRAPYVLSSTTRPIRPNTSSRIPVTPRYSEKYPNHSEPFRCPNIVVQYIDLYVSTISRLLVMSPISSGTPNYLRYIKSHKLIIPIVIDR